MPRFKIRIYFHLCSVSWCVLSNAEEQKCLDLSGNATALNIRGTLRCVRGLNTRDCMDKIKVPEKVKFRNWIVWLLMTVTVYLKQHATLCFSEMFVWLLSLSFDQIHEI